MELQAAVGWLFSNVLFFPGCKVTAWDSWTLASIAPPAKENGRRVNLRHTESLTSVPSSYTSKINGQRKTKHIQPHIKGCKSRTWGKVGAREEKRQRSEEKKATLETKDYREMSCSPGSLNQRVTFLSNGKPRPEHSSLSITEIELPPYWLCTKQTISRMRAKCYSPYKPCCISSLCLRLLGARWIIEDVRVSAKRGSQRITANITKSHFHWNSSEARTFPWFAEHADSAGRDVSCMFKQCADQQMWTQRSFFFFFFNRSYI